MMDFPRVRCAYPGYLLLATLEASSLTKKASPLRRKASALPPKALAVTFAASSPAKKASTSPLFLPPGNEKSAAHDVSNVIVDVQNPIDAAFFVNPGAFHIESNVDSAIRRRFLLHR